jgi:WD40 repeat protein/tetratricopeptide (TPR) repeat protein/tRNA A-37 threonylcarbamoyl transferase component Bud32
VGWPAVAGYEILGELGRGSMGVVYKARQVSLHRLVALKMILAGSHAGPQHLARFRSEAEAVARLQHPHIVQIYEVGAQEGRPYFSLELVDGDTLDRKLAGTPLPARQAAQLVETLARAVQAAHERGIVHRDLKPANVLLTADGTPKITDFGLAKHLDRDGTQTGSDAILGTPCYMAPEQASGKSKEVGPPADIYALGAILYELLTGRPPFKGPSVLNTLEQVRSQEPVSPSRLQPQLPHDLETICLKCLEKEPPRRYATAGALAEELRRFLNNEPILARPIGVWGRGLKWARRRPAVAGLLTTLALVIAGGLVAMTTLWLRAEEQRQAATGAKAIAEQQRDEARGAKEEAHQQRSAAEKANARLDEQLVRLSASHGLQLLQEGDLLGSLPPLAQALKRERPEREEVHRLRLAAILGQCPRLVQLWSHAEAVHCAAFSPDGSQVVTGCADGTVQVWDAVKGRAVTPPLKHTGLVQHAAFSPDGDLLVTASLDGTATVWDLVKQGKPLTLSIEDKFAVRRAVFSPDGRRILTTSVDGKARLWDPANGNPAVALELGTRVRHAAFSPDGQRVVTASLDHTARVWDANTGEPIGRALKHEKDVWYAAFSPDGRRVVTASLDQTAQVWALARDEDSWERVTSAFRHDGEVIAATFSPDGQRVVTASLDQTARIWEVATGKLLTPPLEHKHYVNLAVFSPDGRSVLTASDDETAMVWDATTGKPLTPPLKHGSVVRQAAFSPDGRLVLTASDDRTARVWDVTAGQSPIPFLRHGGAVNQVTFSPDGLRVVTASDDRTARVWNVATGQPVSPPLQHEGKVFRAVFSPDGERVVTASKDGTARVWNAVTGQPLTPPLKHRAPVFRAVFSPDGRWVATADGSGTARVWDAATGRALTPFLKQREGDPRRPIKKKEGDGEVWKPRRGDGRSDLQGLLVLPLVALQAATPVQPVAPTQPTQPEPTGAPAGVPAGLLGSGGSSPGAEAAPTTAPMGGSEAQARASADAEELASLRAVHITFSPDGQWLATAANGTTVQVWDLAAAAPTPASRVPLHHQGTVFHVEFSRSGNLFLTVAAGEALIWDMGNERPRLAWELKHPGLVYSASFSADGKQVVTGGDDRTARVWNTATGKLLMPPLKHATYVRQAAFSPDGHRVFTTSADEARVWDAATGEPLTPPLKHGSDLMDAALSPDGRRVSTAGRDWTARLWVLSSRDERPANDHLLLAELLAGRRFNDSGDFVPSEAATLTDAYRTLNSKYPAVFASSDQPRLAWHRREADDSERQALAESLNDKLTTHESKDEKPLPPGDEASPRVTAKDKRSRAARYWFAAAWHLSFLIDADKSDDTLRYRRGRARAELGDWKKALQDLLAIDPKKAGREVSFLRGRAQARLGHWDKAAADYAMALEWTPHDGALWLAKSMASAQRGQGEQASAEYAQAVTLAKFIELKLDQSWDERERSSAGVSPWREVLADLSWIIERQPDAQWARRDRGLAHAALGQWREARDDFRLASATEAARGLTRALAERKEWSAALQACSEAVHLQERDPSLWYLRGIIHAKLGQYEQAISDHDHALQLGLFPRLLPIAEGSGIRVERGHAYAELGQWDKAAANFILSIELKLLDERGLAQTALGLLRMRVDLDLLHVDERVLAWTALAHLGDDNSKGYRQSCAGLVLHAGSAENSAITRRAVWVCVLRPDAVAKADRPRLVQLAEQALEMEPNNPDCLGTLGAALYRAGRFPAAIQRLNEAMAAAEKRPTFHGKKAVKLDKPPVEFKEGSEPPPLRGTVFDWLFLAMAHEECGFHDEAQRWLDHAVRWMERREQGKSEAHEGAASRPWERRLALQQLHREAQNLINANSEKPR